MYAYDVEKKEAKLIHSGVFSFKVSHDASTIIISDGTGGIFKYNKKHEKKGDYTKIQSSGVSSVLDISSDGKYVLYSQVLSGTNYYTLTLAKTDFETTEELDKLSVKDRLANKQVSKAPVIIAQNFKKFLGGSDDLSIIYYELNGKDKTANLCAFKNFKENVVLAEKEYEVYFINAGGKILYSQSAKNTKKIADVVTDKLAQKDAKLKKKSASKKDWQAKVDRDNIRDKINTYLNSITTTTFYQFDKAAKQAEKVTELSGQINNKGVDKEVEKVFFGTTLYNFEKAKKPDISKVKVAYKLFDEIKSRTFSAVGFDGEEQLVINKDTEYNSGDCFVDTQSGEIHIIMDFDYLDKKVGTLYSVAYDKKGFGTATRISEDAAKVAHFESSDGVYYVLANGSLVHNDAKTLVLKNYAYSATNAQAKIAYTSKDTGKKDDFGNAVTIDTAYLIDGNQSVKLGEILKTKEIIVKGDMLAFYTSYDYKETNGTLMLYNGEELIKLGDKVSMVYTFGE